MQHAAAVHDDGEFGREAAMERLRDGYPQRIREFASVDPDPAIEAGERIGDYRKVWYGDSERHQRYLQPWHRRSQKAGGHAAEFAEVEQAVPRHGGNRNYGPR